jgi:carboxylesterase
MEHYSKGIIFVHGIQGSPGQFDFLTEKIPEGIYTKNILLPGHGASVKEFRQAGGEQWKKAVLEECRKAKKQCDKLFFVGHSMGCLLGMLTEREQALFSGMLLICCPFYVFPTYRYWRNNFWSLCLKGKTNDPFIRAAWEANSVSARHAVSYLFCVHPYMELFRLMRSVKKEKIDLPPKTVFCFSEKDEIVHRRSIAYADWIRKDKAVILSGSGHNYFTTESKEKLGQILQELAEIKKI